MQQTNKYKLNLIESSDPFLPDGLNANTQKVEDVLSEQLGGMQRDLEAIAKSLGEGGRTARIAYGSYTGTGDADQAHPNTLTLDFSPLAVAINSRLLFRDTKRVLTGTTVSSTTGAPINHYLNLSWSENSLSWYYSSDSGAKYTGVSAVFQYVAIGFDPEA